jgi:hypothetical protein
MLSGADLRGLVLRIASLLGGTRVALEIVAMRLYSDDNRKVAPPFEILDVGRSLLRSFEFPPKSDRNPRYDVELSRVVRHSLNGNAGAPIAKTLCRKYVAAVNSYQISASDFDDLIVGLMKAQPTAMLDQFFSGSDKAKRRNIGIINQLVRQGNPVLESIPENVLFEWIAKDPSERYPLITAVAKLYERAKNDEPQVWLPLALRLLKSAPNPAAVLTEMISRLSPTSWSGSLSTKLEARIKLLRALPIGEGVELREELEKGAARLSSWMSEERQREMNDSRARDNRFE